MKKSTLFLMVFFMLTACSSIAQSDIIAKHNGEVIKGNVIRITEYTIVYSYENETSENTIGKYSVAKVTYGKSGREEQISDKIEVAGEGDWEKVVLLEDKSYIAGLKKVDEIRGKTSFINLQTGNTGDKKSLKKLKMAAAKMNCPFIYMTAEKTTVGSSSNQLGGSQSIKTGIAYSY